MTLPEIIFAVIGVLLLVAIAVLWLFCRHGKRHTIAGAASAVGRQGIVVETIENDAGCGQILVGGQEWSARSMEMGKPLRVGETVTVVAVQGVTMICKK